MRSKAPSLSMLNAQCSMLLFGLQRDPKQTTLCAKTPRATNRFVDSVTVSLLLWPVSVAEMSAAADRRHKSILDKALAHATAVQWLNSIFAAFDHDQQRQSSIPFGVSLGAHE